MKDIGIIETKIDNAQLSTWKHAPAWLYERWRLARERIAIGTDKLWRNIMEQERLGTPIEVRRK